LTARDARDINVKYDKTKIRNGGKEMEGKLEEEAGNSGDGSTDENHSQS
jgi:hypothetical protein